jgi:3-deoxy-D-manno-octulosonate 8-phosphate phosphatase KdsC-like HAD superfamily phosphatase
MKVLFLDIDGVLNNGRIALARGGYPMELSERHLFDEDAITLIRRVCYLTNTQIVMSSSWRFSHTVKEFTDFLGTEVIDKTGVDWDGIRGKEIQEWLDNTEHNIEAYAIIDDDSDMLESQKANFVQTSTTEGMSFKNYEQLCSILGADPYDKLPWEK